MFPWTMTTVGENRMETGRREGALHGFDEYRDMGRHKQDYDFLARIDDEAFRRDSR